MKKRNESSLVTACMKYLQCLENLGKIAWHDRLNSGSYNVTTRRRDKHGVWTSYNSRVQGCRKGTPDIFFVTPYGQVVWVECKRGTKQSSGQTEFQNKFDQLPNHYYMIAESTDDINRFLINLELL